MIKFLLFTVLISGFCYSCNNKPTNKLEREGEPTIYSIEDSDTDMNQAIQKARQSLDTFEAALKSEKPSNQRFVLKVKFDTETGGEHIWIGNISLQNGKYYGIVDNVPDNIMEVKVGDIMEVDKNNISDWMFIENNVLQGGYTVRVLRNKMNEAERKAFDTEYGIIIRE